MEIWKNFGNWSEFGNLEKIWKFGKKFGNLKKKFKVGKQKWKFVIRQKFGGWKFEIWKKNKKF